MAGDRARQPEPEAMHRDDHAALGPFIERSKRSREFPKVGIGIGRNVKHRPGIIDGPMETLRGIEPTWSRDHTRMFTIRKSGKKLLRDPAPRALQSFPALRPPEDMAGDYD